MSHANISLQGGLDIARRLESYPFQNQPRERERERERERVVEKEEKENGKGDLQVNLSVIASTLLIVNPIITVGSKL